MNRHLHSGLGKNLAAVIVLSMLGLGVASRAVSQTTQSPAKATKPATVAVKKATSTNAGQTLIAPVKVYGSKSAPITFEVFSDYECPSCRNLYENTLRPLINDYVASGKVYLVHRDFPLPMHKYGYEAARWANASARVGEFQSVEAALYDNQASWSADGNIAKYVSAAMSPAEFQRVQKLMQGCEATASASTHSPQTVNVAQVNRACALDAFIDEDRELGNRIPVKATPTYVITYKGQHLPAGSGIVSWPILKQFFDSLLAQ
ncbi:MAG: thioredoxin domain-containing protein [Candidatus Acidiferrales bacterium]